jgi:Uma2 family endonuclease
VFPDFWARGFDGMAIVLLDEDHMSLSEFIRSAYHSDGNWELFRGELVAMSPAKPRHEVVVNRVGQLLTNALGTGPCKVYSSNMGFYLWDDGSFVMADLSIVCDKTKFVDGRCVKGPDLVVEVLSPSTREYCMTNKRDLYKENGTIEYWMADMDEEWVIIENFNTGSRVKHGVDDMVKSDLFECFHFSVKDMLVDILE